MFWVFPALILAAVIGYVLLFRRSVFILAYHGIGYEPSALPGLVIKPEAFRRQLRLLAALGFQGVTVDVLVQSIFKEEADNGSRMISITFDDGYRGLLEHAAPVLQQLSWNATVFVPTAHVGGRNEWDKELTPLGIMDWQQLESLTRLGITIGSHGKSHSSLLQLSDEECLAEARESLVELQTRLTACSRVFSYPFGHRKAGHAALIEKAGYVGGCSLVAGALPNRHERFDLGRLLVRSDSLLAFTWSLICYPLLSLLRNVFRQ